MEKLCIGICWFSLGKQASEVWNILQCLKLHCRMWPPRFFRPRRHQEATPVPKLSTLRPFHHRLRAYEANALEDHLEGWGRRVFGWDIKCSGWGGAGGGRRGYAESGYSWRQCTDEWGGNYFGGWDWYSYNRYWRISFLTRPDSDLAQRIKHWWVLAPRLTTLKIASQIALRRSKWRERPAHARRHLWSVIHDGHWLVTTEARAGAWAFEWVADLESKRKEYPHWVHLDLTINGLDYVLQV